MEKCKICGDIVNYDNFVDDVAKVMKENCLCFSCQLWKERADKLQNEDKYLHPIIDGTYYTVGDEDSKETYFRGFSGARFQIEFNDGHKLISTNLWCGGDIPEVWKDKLSNNARFENNLKWKKVGASICLIEDPDDKKEDVLPF